MKDQVNRIVSLLTEATTKKGRQLGGLDEEISYLGDYGYTLIFFGCKESASNYPHPDLVVKLQDKEHYVRFKALCRLLKVPVNSKIIASFLLWEKTFMVLGGWFNENTLNREVTRFLAKATLDESFESIQDFIKTHYLVGKDGNWQSNFEKFFTNLKKNLELNKDVECVGSQGIIVKCHNHLFKFAEN